MGLHAVSKMKALVLGLGVSGKSAQNFLEKRGVSVVGVDDTLAPQKIDNLSGFDLFVPSPGIAKTHPLYQMAIEQKIPIKGEAELALEACTVPCIGVTGTNGKTTVVKMIEHCLNANGVEAKAVGNVGMPLTSCEQKGIWIVELSSFQLETLHAIVFDVGLVLNIEEDHLDRYESFHDYAMAKAHLENCIKEKGDLFVHESVDEGLFSKPFQYFVGHNEMAARLACAHFGIKNFDALLSFEKPPHRLEFVTQIDDVAYYNDSKATNVAAVLNALEEIDSDVVLIIGGQDKDLSFEPLRQARKKLAHVIVFGQAREKIADALQGLSDVHKVETLHQAVEKAALCAKKADVVLFSPGCASFDAFKNYEERGEAFKRIVRRRIS
ncbi:MAG: UDP-N-acetylmuramoylalanine--D-glutamate ligase [Chlamydiae bacterium]|nr:UDP-N-acetylmuramoylalanine--D-glutamate ligase [Chlamydiota bacterium]